MNANVVASPDPPQKVTEMSKEKWFHVISIWLYHGAAHLLESGVSLGISW